MSIMLLGIVIFLGVHTLTTLRERRTALIGKMGANGYKALYSIGSLIGLALIVYGFGAYRASGYVSVWNPPVWTRHLAIPIIWIAFIALVAAYAPAGKIKGMLKHPMLVAVKAWALAHLLANGDLGSMILFGSFLGWAVYDRIAVKKRGDTGAPPAPFGKGDWIAIGGGTVAFILVFAAHKSLIGVRVLG